VGSASSPSGLSGRHAAHVLNKPWTMTMTITNREGSRPPWETWALTETLCHGVPARVIVKIERLAGPVTHHGEGPVWSSVWGGLNDGGCDPQGRFPCGSKATDDRPGSGALYRLDTDGSVETVLTGITISNGLDCSPDGHTAYGHTAYCIDTPTQTVAAFDYGDDGRCLADRRSLASITPELGQPHGLTVDAEGGVWAALFGGAAIHRYSPDGRLDAVIELPVAQVTACAFGGADLDRLFITTSRLGSGAALESDAGSLCSCIPGIRGLSSRNYHG
jgi:SMP-30/Gluconolactonase/LRE-like region